MSGQYNLRNPAVKRLMKEAQELNEPTEQFFAQPIEDNLFEWHFTIRGPADTEFHGGIYHGRIILPPEYPMKPPSIMILTPNGRFEIFKKICLSISGHHPESWQPSWSIRTALLAIIGFMPTHGNGAIGSLDYTADERKVLAKKSLEWKCSECGSIKAMLKPVTEASKKTTEEAKELASQINFQDERAKNKASKESESPKDVPDSSAAEGAASSETSTAEPALDPSGAASPQQTFQQQAFPPFPGAQGYRNFFMGPNSNMPRPSAPSGPNTGSMPRFMPPWFGMVPPVAAPGTNQQNSQNPFTLGSFPPNQWPMFPPMMMHPQMMAMMAQQQMMLQQQALNTNPMQQASAGNLSNPSTPRQTGPSQVTSNASASTTTITSQPTPSSSINNSTSPSTTHSTNSASIPITSASEAQPDRETSSSASPETSNAGQNVSSTSSPTTSTTASANPNLRQRLPPTGSPRPSGDRRATTPSARVAPVQQRQNTAGQGENPFLLIGMAMLGLAIMALLLRRLYTLWATGGFDYGF